MNGVGIAKESSIGGQQKKCQFGRDKIDYLGHIVSKNGVEVDPERLKTCKIGLYHMTCEI